MANEVFVNDLEVACKAADGVSSCAFPDPCFTPSGPIPFPNTAYAKDTANGSKTVFISGKEVVLKDYSYFKTSTGNEAAKGRKGLATGDNKGKAYFRSWSMNVKIEGYNVCRHTDSMTHNHGSYPGNTLFWKYTDTAIASIDDCKKEKKRVKKACGRTEKKAKKWKSKNCKLLSFKPSKSGLKGLGNPKKKLNELNSVLANTNVMSKVLSAAESAVMDFALKKALLLGAKMVGTKFVPVVGWIYSIFTAKEDIASVQYYTTMYDGAHLESQRIVNDLKNVKFDIEDAIEKISKGDYKGAADKLADWQRDAGTANACLRARKCMLVPYSKTTKQSGGMNTSEGCCPGQTAHHLIPHSFAKGKCSSYSHGNAPCVCAEGTTQYRGSHGAIHTATTEMLVPKKDWDSTARTTKTSYDDVRDGVIKAHAKVFPFSGCSRDCLKEQLDNYYKECKDMQVKRIGSNPTEITEDISMD